MCPMAALDNSPTVGVCYTPKRPTGDAREELQRSDEKIELNAMSLCKYGIDVLNLGR